MPMPEPDFGPEIRAYDQDQAREALELIDQTQRIERPFRESFLKERRRTMEYVHSLLSNLTLLEEKAGYKSATIISQSDDEIGVEEEVRSPLSRSNGKRVTKQEETEPRYFELDWENFGELTEKEVTELQILLRFPVPAFEEDTRRRFTDGEKHRMVRIGYLLKKKDVGALSAFVDFHQLGQSNIPKWSKMYDGSIPLLSA